MDYLVVAILWMITVTIVLGFLWVKSRALDKKISEIGDDVARKIGRSEARDIVRDETGVYTNIETDEVDWATYTTKYYKAPCREIVKKVIDHLGLEITKEPERLTLVRKEKEKK